MSDRSIRRYADVAPQVERFLAERGGRGDRPLYARVGFAEVHRSFHRHAPVDPAGVSLPPWTDDTPGAREDFARYDGAIRDMDAAVGRILGALDRAGLRDETLAIFTTDHGSPFPGAKGTLYEAGIRTALLMRWPAGCAGGRVVPELISGVDLFPTVLEAAGLTVPPDVQGRSFLPLLRNQAYRPREAVFAEKDTVVADLKRCVRTHRFKYIRNAMSGPHLIIPDAEISLPRRDLAMITCGPGRKWNSTTLTPTRPSGSIWPADRRSTGLEPTWPDVFCGSGRRPRIPS